MSFTTNFTWGVAAASYQIEGAWDEEGKGLSVWDTLVRQPGRSGKAILETSPAITTIATGRWL
jgi:beta-glucosidase/6-phospho-beta-glucosidase/beta-galactosidase